MEQNTQNLAMSAKQLNEELSQQNPLLLFDIRIREKFEESHVEGSVHAVCDAQSKEKIIQKFQKMLKLF